MPSVPTQNKVKWTAAVDGVDLGSFMTKSGGATAGESLKIRPAGGEQELALSSLKSYEDIDIAKLCDDFMWSKYAWLDSRVNKGAMVVSGQPLDADDNPFGSPHGARGLLIGLTPPDSDANASTEAPITLKMSVESVF